VAIHEPTGGDVVKALSDRIEAVARRSRETPGSEQLQEAIDQLEDLVNDLADQVNTLVTSTMTNYYTKSETNTKVTTPGDINPSNVTASGSVTAQGNMQAAGSISTTGSDISTPNALRGANIYATAAPGYNITGTRVAGWWESATGRGGTASSSRRFKTDIEAVELDHLRGILGVGIMHWSYVDEVRKRDDPTFEGYVGPDYHVAVNIGAIAEDLHAAGLWELVVYERDRITEEREIDGELVDVVIAEPLKLDDDGQPIPFGIHDILISYSLIPLLADHEHRLAAIETHLGLTPAS
jgi:hypothetical protein